MESNLEKVLINFGDKVTSKAKQNLVSDGHKDKGGLYNSLDYEFKVSKRSFQFAFFMEDYGPFVDKGVKGTVSSSKAPNSPYKFGTGTGESGGLTNGINDWVKRKRFQFRKPNGTFMSYESTAFTIIRNIWRTGQETTNFFTTPFEREFAKLPDEVVEAYALDMDKFFDYTTKIYN